MRKFVLKSLVILFVTSGFIAQAQEDDLAKVKSNSITGVYEELTDDGYKFWTAQGKEDSIVFARALSNVLKEYDLDSNELVGKKFMITYKIITEVVEYGDEDDDNEEVEETNTIHIIIGLKKIV